MSIQPPFSPSSSGGYGEFGDAPTMPSQIPTPDQLPPRPPQHDPYAPTHVVQPPSFPPPLAPLWPPAPPPQQADGAPPRAQRFGVPPAPGAPATPPRKLRAGPLVLIGIALVVLGVGAVAGFVVLRPGSTAATPTCALSGYIAFTSPDHTFCLVYPTGWQVTGPLKGSGAQFSGPARQIFTVANIGAFSSTPTDYDVGVCRSLLGRITQVSTITLSGQVWTQASCALDAGRGRFVVEAVIDHGNLYHMDYGSSTATFLSNQSQMFVPMEQSFRFLS